ncbi:MAG: hypothetical protein M3R38_19885 [Actinomycetota bacterium]|nr:hypothetical protein [Actinomycetota bacterium]
MATWPIYEPLDALHSYAAIAGAGREFHLFFSRSIEERYKGMGGTGSVFRGLAAIVAAGLAASLLLILAAAKPVEAAPPGDNGKIAFTRVYGLYEGSDLYLMDPDGTNLTQITNHPGDDTQPALSPDGTKVAFVSDRGGASSDIYVMKAAPEGADNQPVRLTTEEGSQVFPDFSPDGAKIVYTSNDGQVWTMNAQDGSGKRMLTNDPVDKREPAWSPDGERVVYVTNNGICVGCTGPGDNDVYAVNADGSGEPINLTNSPEDEVDVAFSPDGTKIAFSRFFAVLSGAYWQTDYEIFVKDLASGAETNLTNSTGTTELNPAFSPDGTRVAFMKDNEIFTADAADGSGQANVTNSPSNDQQPDWGLVPPPDTSAPTISLTMPTNGATYKLNSTANAAYSCTDETGGSGLKSCTGAVPDGSPIDTGTTGTKTFTVNAEDNAGNPSSVTHTYYVTKSGKPPASGGGKGGGKK